MSEAASRGWIVRGIILARRASEGSAKVYTRFRVRLVWLGHSVPQVLLHSLACASGECGAVEHQIVNHL
jgi:hypothetical protein